MTNDLKKLDDELNDMIRRGQVSAAIERFYAEDVEMRENGDPPTRGRAANLAREEEFFKIAVIHDAHLLSQTVGDGVTTTEWAIDWTVAGKRGKLEQVAVRRWRDGQIVAERFYYRP